MRRSSLRPRQIDVHARMAIIRGEKDLDADEDSTAGSSQPHMTFQQLVANLEARQKAGSQLKRKKKDIPIPVILSVSSYDASVSADFEVPTSYVRFQALPRDENSGGSETSNSESPDVEVDLDLEDMRWLRRHPKYGVDGDPRYQVSQERFGQMLDALEKASALLNPNVMTLAEAEEVFARRLNMHKTPLNRVTCDVYAYWAAKRQKLRRPLLRRYWPQTPLNDTNPHSVFRPREKERYKLRKHRKNDLEGFRKLQQLRVDFERVRRILDLVRRRERARRLQLDFLDEIRRQAEHELHKPWTECGGDLKNGGDGKAAATVVEGPQIAPSFMEYDTSANFVMEDPTDTDGSPRKISGPVYPSYPLSPPLLMAAIFQQPPKYRCRGRIGRGGRLVMDRIPVPSSRYYGPTETIAPSFKSNPLIASGVVAGSRTPENGGSSLPIANAELDVAANHGAILVQELSIHPLMHKINQVTSKRLDEIYGMSDSEDEILEPLSSSVYETPITQKTLSGGKGLHNAHAEPDRKVKFTLDV
ncbi:unnamed protein product [Peronospora destructor]|uniref:Enhancer of polycomb-like protein n=1 Tax=Peronospora destructor TaxID=86335 RepID=A0AAV0TIQ5_9STRA|nr:unnamed protein product [Peronospora destructor]